MRPFRNTTTPFSVSTISIPGFSARVLSASKGHRFLLVANFAVLITDNRQDQLKNVLGNSMAITGQS